MFSEHSSHRPLHRGFTISIDAEPIQRIALASLKVVLDVAEGLHAAEERAQATGNSIIYLEDGLNDLVEEQCGESGSPTCLLAVYASQLAHCECSYYEESFRWSLGPRDKSGWSKDWGLWDTHQCCIEFKVSGLPLNERAAFLREAWRGWLQLIFETTSRMTIDLSFAEENSRQFRTRLWGIESDHE